MGHDCSDYEDEDGIDKPFDDAMDAAMEADREQTEGAHRRWVAVTLTKLARGAAAVIAAGGELGLNLPGEVADALETLREALPKMEVERDRLRQLAELPPVEPVTIDGLSDAQAAMVADLAEVEDALNQKGHSMERKDRCD